MINIDFPEQNQGVEAVLCQCFKTNETVLDFSGIPIEELRHLKDGIREIFAPTEFMDEERIEALSVAVTCRVEELQDMERGGERDNGSRFCSFCNRKAEAELLQKTSGV